MNRFSKKTAVLTGAASGFGLECARIAARAGMHVVMVDVQADALEVAAVEVQWLASQVDGGGGRVLARRVDVSSAAEMEALDQQIFDLLEVYRERIADPALRPEGSRPVRMLALAVADDRMQGPTDKPSKGGDDA